jgi:hypothetical protein
LMFEWLTLFPTSRPLVHTAQMFDMRTLRRARSVPRLLEQRNRERTDLARRSSAAQCEEGAVGLGGATCSHRWWCCCSGVVLQRLGAVALERPGLGSPATRHCLQCGFSRSLPTRGNRSGQTWVS